VIARERKSKISPLDEQRGGPQAKKKSLWSAAALGCGDESFGSGAV